MKQNLFLPLCTSLSLIEDCCQDPIGVFPALHQSTPTPQPLRDSSKFLMRLGDHVCHSCLDCPHVATIFLEAQRYPKTIISGRTVTSPISQIILPFIHSTAMFAISATA